MSVFSTFSVTNSFFFFAVRLTLSIAPIYAQLIIVDVPPLLMSGNGWPVTGTIPTATSILAAAWMTSIMASPMHRKAGKLLSQRLAILAVRNSNTIYKNTTRAAPSIPISSMMMA